MGTTCKSAVGFSAPPPCLSGWRLEEAEEGSVHCHRWVGSHAAKAEGSMLHLENGWACRREGRGECAAPTEHLYEHCTKLQSVPVSSSNLSKQISVNLEHAHTVHISQWLQVCFHIYSYIVWHCLNPDKLRLPLTMVTSVMSNYKTFNKS